MSEAEARALEQLAELRKTGSGDREGWHVEADELVFGWLKDLGWTHVSRALKRDSNHWWYA